MPPSPKSHTYDVIDPSGSDDPDPSKLHVNPVHDTVNDATGTRFDGGGSTGLAVPVSVSVAPSLSVTVNATVLAPAEAKAWAVVGPLPLPPSPKSHTYDVIDPSGSNDPDPSKLHVNPVHDTVNDATGTRFDGGGSGGSVSTMVTPKRLRTVSTGMPMVAVSLPANRRAAGRFWRSTMSEPESPPAAMGSVMSCPVNRATPRVP
jgi:hypothetical protein